MRGQRGFTLVEMLVAISVASLLVGLVYGAIRVGQRSVSAVEMQVRHSEIMRIGWEFLRDSLGRALPMPNPIDPEDRNSFAGTTKVLTFIADTPAYLGQGGLMRFTLGIEDEPGRSQLVLTRQRYDIDEEAAVEQPLQQAVLLEDPKNLEIRYYGLVEGDETADWHEEWLGMQTLPNLVSIDVQPAEGTAWPTLVASPSSGSAPLGEDDTQFTVGASKDEHSGGQRPAPPSERD